jgi:hypothetical protein
VRACARCSIGDPLSRELGWRDAPSLTLVLASGEKIHCRITRALHVRGELNDVAVLPPAIKQVSLTVIVAENHLVDGLGAVLDRPDQRLA